VGWFGKPAVSAILKKQLAQKNRQEQAPWISTPALCLALTRLGLPLVVHSV
jgi:hypothetical protein